MRKVRLLLIFLTMAMSVAMFFLTACSSSSGQGADISEDERSGLGNSSDGSDTGTGANVESSIGGLVGGIDLEPGSGGLAGSGENIAASAIAGGALTREDFNFYDGMNVIDIDGESVVGGVKLRDGWATARGFLPGDGLQRFSELYGGLTATITVIGNDSEATYYPRAVIEKNVTEIARENSKAVSFVLIHEGYTLTFDYTTATGSFEVTVHGMMDNSRVQAIGLLTSASQYIMFGPYPPIWPDVGHLPWAEEGIDEVIYLNLRNETLNQSERVFMYEIAETFADDYGIPIELEEMRSFYESLNDEEKAKIDTVGQKIWSWVQENVESEMELMYNTEIEGLLD